jgi:aminopeptidase-like protein
VSTTAQAGAQMVALVRDLYPICRSITGDGVRQTLARLREEIALEVHEVPSGTQAFDWTVPREWNIRDAYVKDANGQRVIDFRQHNLHVVNYSVPVYARMSFAELRPHLHSLPDRPDSIPYRTSYYRESWGFCLAHRELERLEAMPDAQYEVCIDSTLAAGHLTYGELLIPGESTDEVLFSCHVCHPSLADDNLSGIAVATFLAQWVAALPKRRHSYRFVFVPGTIGSITWLSRNQEGARRIKHGLVLTCVGDRAGFNYKRTRHGDTDIDRAVAHVLQHSAASHALQDFSPYGYDERQYNSPGFKLAVGCLMRSAHGTFPEYHTSADNLDFISADALAETLATVRTVVQVLENNRIWRNLSPYCEPQLGKRGLYSATGGEHIRKREMAMLWVMNLSDGEHSLLDIARRAGLPFHVVHEAAQLLAHADLLEHADTP